MFVKRQCQLNFLIEKNQAGDRNKFKFPKCMQSWTATFSSAALSYSGISLNPCSEQTVLREKHQAGDRATFELFEIIKL